MYNYAYGGGILYDVNKVLCEDVFTSNGGILYNVNNVFCEDVFTSNDIIYPKNPDEVIAYYSLLKNHLRIPNYVFEFKNLKLLSMPYNQLIDVNLRQFPKLQYLNLERNLLSQVDTSYNKNLIEIRLDNNQIIDNKLTNEQINDKNKQNNEKIDGGVLNNIDEIFDEIFIDDIIE